MIPTIRSTRRSFLAAGSIFTASAFSPRTTQSKSMEFYGVVNGQPQAATAGMKVLAEGGNAIDAVVAAALVSAIVSPNSTGIGGYGMSAVIATEGGKKVTAIDGNTTAPSSITRDHFQPDAGGKYKGGIHPTNIQSSVGWNTVGVPGVLAGLQLAIDRFGTRGFGELVQPAIGFARDGIPVTKGMLQSLANNNLLRTDPGSKKVFMPDGELPKEGSKLRNHELATLLESLASANRVTAFYTGDIATQIVGCIQKNGGLLTREDLANYRANIVEPLSISIEGQTIYTAPLTAGGISVLQGLRLLEAMRWKTITDPLQRLHAKIEATRLVWRDRLTLLGDPNFSQVPIDQLLSHDYARSNAEILWRIVQSGKWMDHKVLPRKQTGTIHLNAVDRLGNCAALTLTHGNGYGACVTVDGLGLTLGHGLSRFDATPGHPNGPEPGKRPLHNMVPTIIMENNSPKVVLGGTGGRKIPNSLLDILTEYLFSGDSMEDAMTSPRLHTEGSPSISLDRNWPEAHIEFAKKVGYAVTREGGANMSAITRQKDAWNAVPK
jgi:gamma-glutamyltranspeptidase/glutathione hydrolase